MKNVKPTHMDTIATRDQFASDNNKLSRNQAEREKGMRSPNCLPGQNATGRKEKESKDEMEDLYREEENRATVDAT